MAQFLWRSFYIFMAQSSVNESCMMGAPPSSQYHTINPPTQWKDLRDMFQLAIIAKENIHIENQLNPSDLLKAESLQLEEENQNKSTMAKTERIARNIEEKEDSTNQKVFKLETKIFNKICIEKSDKKIRSRLNLVLRSEGNRIYAQNFLQFKTLRINFAELCEYLNQAFIRKPTLTFEHHKLLKRCQRDKRAGNSSGAR